jgi:hypothetical protein
MMGSNTLCFYERENGPPRVVHGGTLAGRMAQIIGGPAEVTLRRPAPLATDLTLSRRDATISLLRGADLLAEAVPTRIDLQPPPPPTLEEAIAASQKYAGHLKHAFPTCWVCGTARAPGDGMRIFAGPLDKDLTVAAEWTPHATLADSSGLVKPEFVWAALDCPGAWAALLDVEQKPVVLGRIAARLDHILHAGEPHIVTAWKIATEGRKHVVGSAIFDVRGTLRAIARATWFEIEGLDWT